MADNTNTTPLAITDKNGCIEDGQRASYVRYSMENKNLLENKYDIYVGTGEIINDGVSRGTQGMNIIEAINAATVENDVPNINIRNGELSLRYSTQNQDYLSVVSNKQMRFQTSKYILAGGDDGSSADIAVDDRLILRTNSGIWIHNYNNDELYTKIEEDSNGYFNIITNKVRLSRRNTTDLVSEFISKLPVNIYVDSNETESPLIVQGGKNPTAIKSIGGIEIHNGEEVPITLTASTGKITCISISSKTISATGGITSGSTIEAASFNATSDERLKTNIKDLNYHDSILDIPVREYDWKESGKHAIGFVAQELQKIYPELVDENENGILSIKETKLVYLLIEEVKKLKKEIENLKKEG